ncbi:unnamed protein product [Adineta ricciae]|uniref:DUF7709 domain-containing protein n=1 Tax=Adineta ricciae TaxID=249248 RepID=A0A816FE82_ADIRI|nr:unnamed protein product [Adineta ricciae]
MTTILCRCTSLLSVTPHRAVHRIFQNNITLRSTTIADRIFDLNTTTNMDCCVYMQQPALIKRYISTTTIANSSKNRKDQISSSENTARSNLAAKYAEILNLKEGTALPSLELKDGTRVQTGTVGSMLKNISLYNEGQRGEVEQLLEQCVPTLIQIGLFNLFPPEEWINTSNSGRRFVGKKAQELLARKDK